MKKFLILTVLFFFFSNVFADEGLSKTDDLNNIENLFVNIKKTNDIYIDTLNGLVKVIYIARGKLENQGRLSKWNQEYYEKMSKVYGDIIQEAEYYNGVIKEWEEIAPTLSKKEKEVYEMMIGGLLERGSKGIYTFYIILSDPKFKKNISNRNLVIYLVISNICLYQNYFEVMKKWFDLQKEAVEKQKIIFSDKDEEQYSARYELEKDLKKLESDFNSYFYSLKLPMLEKIEKILKLK